MSVAFGGHQQCRLIICPRRLGGTGSRFTQRDKDTSIPNQDFAAQTGQRPHPVCASRTDGRCQRNFPGCIACMHHLLEIPVY